MKYIIDSESYEIVVKNLNQAQSLALVVGGNSEDENTSNVFWIIQDLVNYAKHLVQNSETIRN